MFFNKHNLKLFGRGKNMKKIISCLLALCMLAGCSASNNASGKYTAGTYSASAKGFGGDVTPVFRVSHHNFLEVSF